MVVMAYKSDSIRLSNSNPVTLDLEVGPHNNNHYCHKGNATSVTSPIINFSVDHNAEVGTGEKKGQFLSSDFPLLDKEKIVKIINNNKFVIIFAVLEIFAVLTIFLLSYFSYLDEKTKSFVALTDCSDCDSCDGMYSLQEQSGYNQLELVVNSNNNTEINSNFSTYIQLASAWSSCSLFQQDDFVLSTTGGYSEPDAKVVEYLPTQANAYKNETILNSFAEIPVDGQMILEDDDVSGEHYDFRDDDHRMCFQLLCSASISTISNNTIYVDYDGGEEYSMDGLLRMSVNSYAGSNIEISAEIGVTTSTVSGSCTASVYGSVLPFYTISNSVVLSDTYQCTTSTKKLTAMSLALANALSLSAVFRVIYRVAEFIQKLR